MNTFGYKLKSLREINNYKQEYVGGYVGLSQSAYSRIENGEVENVSLKQVEKFAELYKMTPEQLIGWDGKINIGTVHGVGVNQGTYNNIAPDERIKQLEIQVQRLLERVGA